MNTDAAFKPGDDSCSVGLIIRDHLGTFIAGQVKKVGMVHSVFEAETAAIHEGLQWLLTLHYQHVEIESDSLLAVQALKQADDILLEVGFVLDECRSILKSRPCFSVYFAKRQANKAAHLMAKLPCLLESQSFFMSPPDVLVETLLYDSSA